MSKKNAKINAIIALILTLASSPVLAGPKFERVMDTFNSATAVSIDDLRGESSWAGFCVHADDRVDDALLTFRQANDPIMGVTVKTLNIQEVGSSNYYLRMTASEIRDLLDKSDSSQWNDGEWKNGELFALADSRFHWIARKARTPDTSFEYFVMLKECKSIDAHKCNGTGSAPFIKAEACYYHAKKI